MAQFTSIPSMKANPFSSYFEQFSKSPFQSMQGNPMEALVELNNITTRLCSELARQNLKMMTDLVQCSVEEMQELSQTRGEMVETCHVLSKGAAKVSPTIFQHAHGVLDTLSIAAADYTHLMEENMVKASKAASKYAPTPEKNAQTHDRK